MKNLYKTMIDSLQSMLSELDELEYALVDAKSAVEKLLDEMEGIDLDEIKSDELESLTNWCDPENDIDYLDGVISSAKECYSEYNTAQYDLVYELEMREEEEEEEDED